MTTEIPVYQIKILLRHIQPPIWRRVLVRSDSTLADLHRVIQATMGWDGYHLHEFEVGGRCYGEPDPDWETQDVADEAEVRLDQVITGEGFKMGYLYDFGDNWEHALLVEKVLPLDPQQTYPVCVKGRGAAPPEDVGGVWGYTEFVRALGDPDHPEYQDYLNWWGDDDFDPAAFDIETVNAALQG
jgi:hypothetical protein